MPVQQRYFAEHRFLFLSGVLIGELIEWPDMMRDVQKATVATQDRWIFDIRSGMRKVEEMEFVFNRTNDATSPHIPLEIWNNLQDQRQVTVVATDASADPLNVPSGIVGEWDLGKCDPGGQTFPAGKKDAPEGAKYKFKIMARQLVYRDLV